MYKFKKLITTVLLAVFIISYSSLAFATPADTAQVEPERVIKMENLPAVKNVSSNLVTITNYKAIINKGDVFKVAFAQDFTTKGLQTGDKIIFNLPKGLSTTEGRMLLPCGTQIIGVVTSYTPPKWFNKNAKVVLSFNEILVPNSKICEMGACVYAKNNILQRSGWATVAKPVIWTVGLFGVGAGLGAAFGAAAGNAATGCLAIGMPVGGGVGLLIGVITPGLHYKAKAGKEIPIQLNQAMVIYNPAQ
ncbi:MAG: hypothetical protein PHX18_02880 [Candidatus Gastranaerophilales bacterium]|nr:hypothetical protein [Candidatus Gastranaerophilales bacterium]